MSQISQQPNPFLRWSQSNPFAEQSEPERQDPQRPATLLLDDAARVAEALTDQDMVEVIVGWGTSVLEIRQLAEGMDLLLAPAAPAGMRTGPTARGRQRRGAAAGRSGGQEVVVVPEELVGSAPQLVLRATSGAPRLVLQPGSVGRYRELGAPAFEWSLGELTNRAFPAAGGSGALELPLVRGAVVTVQVAGLWLRFEVSRRPRSDFAKYAPDLAVLAYFAGSFFTFAGFLLSLAYFTPYQGLEDEAELDRERVILLQQYLSAAALREREIPPPTDSASAEQAGGEASAPAPGDPGQAGKPGADRSPKKMAIKGPPNTSQVRMSPQEARALAQTFGMIGLLRASAESDPDAPFSAFGRDPALGADDISARGNMWGTTIGEAAGQNGLFLSGDGFGGLRGPGTGVGIEGISSSIGTLGHCDPSSGRACSFGSSVGHSSGGHTPQGPVLRTAPTEVSGSIPAAVVQRIVRQNFGRFRFCYQQGLARNPSLEGRVAVRFIIDRTGAVSVASALGGGLPDSQVASCVAQAFFGLSFPPPDRGIVTVTYPLLFSPE